VPAGATAVTGNLTVTDQSASGYLYMGPTAMNVPTSSTLNFPIADNGPTSGRRSQPNGHPLGHLRQRHREATTDVVFDVTGYFVPGS